MSLQITKNAEKIVETLVVRTKAILVAPSLVSAFQAHMFIHLRSFFGPDNLICDSLTDDPATQEKMLNRILMRKPLPTGLIAVSVRPSQAAIRKLKEAGIPVVLVDEEEIGASTVMTDNITGGRLAAEHFIRSGRLNLAVVCGHRNVQGGMNAVQRVNGFTQMLKSHAVHLDPSNIFEVAHYSEKDGEELGARLAQKNYNGIFVAAGDMCACGLLRSLRACGKAVPDDVSIIGYDNLTAGEVCVVPLTTIHQPLEDMAKEAFTMVTRDRQQTLVTPQTKVFTPTLICRRSA